MSRVRSSVVTIELDEILSDLSDADLCAECARRGIQTQSTSERRLRAPYVIDRDDLDEALAWVNRGRRSEALLVLQNALPREFRDVFTQPNWRWS